MHRQFGYLLSFISPLTALGFFLSGAHTILSALYWTLPLLILMLADWRSLKVKSRKNSVMSGGFYDALLYSLAVIQFINIVLMLGYVSQLSWYSSTDILSSIVNLIVIRFIVGTSSGCSGIIVAHELIHRPKKLKRMLGQFLLYTVCYGHFTIAHQQGHHRKVGKADDITTARLGESFQAYWKRVILAHFLYAWNFEVKRLKKKKIQGKLAGLIRNRVLQSILIELSLVIMILFIFGFIAAAMFLYQAFIAVRILEAVNYFQHWGLQSEQINQSLGWVSHSWITSQVFIDLSYHIAHHKNAVKQFQELDYSDQGPNMPYGYFVMNLWVKLGNKSYQKMALGELEKFNQSLSQAVQVSTDNS